MAACARTAALLSTRSARHTFGIASLYLWAIQILPSASTASARCRADELFCTASTHCDAFLPSNTGSASSPRANPASVTRANTPANRAAADNMMRSSMRRTAITDHTTSAACRSNGFARGDRSFIAEKSIRIRIRKNFQNSLSGLLASLRFTVRGALQTGFTPVGDHRVARSVSSTA